MKRYPMLKAIHEFLEDNQITVWDMEKQKKEGYDIKNKYQGQVIYQTYQKKISFYNPHLFKNETLDVFPVGTCIWFYNTKIYPAEVFVDDIRKWINENTEILLEESDKYGDLFYVKKIKQIG